MKTKVLGGNWTINQQPFQLYKSKSLGDSERSFSTETSEPGTENKEKLHLPPLPNGVHYYKNFTIAPGKEVFVQPGETIIVCQGGFINRGILVLPEDKYYLLQIVAGNKIEGVESWIEKPYADYLEPVKTS